MPSYLLPLITGLFLTGFLLAYGFYASITIKHASRFRYLSKRTVYLTTVFVALSTALIVLIIGLYLALLLN